MGLKFKIEINAKPDEVFGYLADVSRHGEWSTGGLKAEKTSEGPVGAGSTFRTTQRFQGRDSGAEVTIREYSPPSKLVLLANQKGAKFVHTFTLTPSGSGTVVVRDVGREDASPFAALGIIFYPAIRADAMKGLRGLKAKIEGGAR